MVMINISSNQYDSVIKVNNKKCCHMTALFVVQLNCFLLDLENKLDGEAGAP